MSHADPISKAILRLHNRRLVRQAKLIGPEAVAEVKKRIACERMRLARLANPALFKERQRRFRETPRGIQARKLQHRRRQLREHGLTLAEYESLLESQGGGCAICGGADPNFGPYENFLVDHDHDTGRVRGIVCHPCNVTLGAMGDNLEGAIRRAEAAREELMARLRFVDYLNR